MIFAEMMMRNEAEIAFSGLGPFDVFRLVRRKRVYVGTVLLDLDNPPFVVGDGRYFKFASGFVLLPHGLEDVLCRQ